MKTKKKQTEKQKIASKENWNMAQIIVMESIIHKINLDIKDRVPHSDNKNCVLSDLINIKTLLLYIKEHVKQFQRLRILNNKEA